MATAAFWRERRVFLTGHTSLKGAWLSVMLKLLNARVTGYAHRSAAPDSLFTRARIGEKLCDVRGDLNDAAFLDGALRAAEPDIVIHLPSPDDNSSYSVLLEAAHNNPTTQAILILNDSAPGESSEAIIRPENMGDLSGDGPVLVFVGCGAAIGNGDYANGDPVANAAHAFAKGDVYVAPPTRGDLTYAHPLDQLHACLMLAEQICDEACTAVKKIRLPTLKRHSLCEMLDAFTASWGEGAVWRQRSDWIDGTASYVRDAHIAQIAPDACEFFAWEPLLDLTETMEWTALWHKALHRRQDMAAIMRAQTEIYLGLRLQFAAPARLRSEPQKYEAA